MTSESKRLFDESLVLVLTDNGNFSANLNAILTSAGLKPIFVSRAEKGLSILQHAKEAQTPVPLAICDYALPDMTGFNFLKSLRTDPRIRDQKVILLTPDHPVGHMPVFAPLGISHIIQWPGRSENLTGAIAEYIPLRREEPAIASISAEPSRNDTGFRILAADDNAINLAVLKGFLNLSGYTPDTVVNGAEAVKAFKNAQYDLILMDVSMPVMDGVVATLQIREIEKQVGSEPVPIVAVTAHYTASQKQRYLEAGMNDVIAKPISQREIQNCLEQWCPRFEAQPQKIQATG